MSLREDLSFRFGSAVSDDAYGFTTTHDGRPLAESQGSSRFSVFSIGSGKPWSPSAVLTPPNSQLVSPAAGEPEDNTSISVSSVFFSGAFIDAPPADIIVLTSDSVIFYVHSSRLLAVSENGFNLYLPPSPNAVPFDNEAIIQAPERSSVMNLLLHAVYDIPCAQKFHSFEDLTETVATLNVYGLPIQTFLTHTSPLSDALLVHAPTRPLDLYALAASYELHDLAVASSPHLLSLSLSSISDEMAMKIGPVYLKKLFFLHLGRTDALKRLLPDPPIPHTPTRSCGSEEQKELTRTWAHAIAYLASTAEPHTSASSIETTLRHISDHITCALCKTSIQDRVHNLATQWSEIKITVL